MPLHLGQELLSRASALLAREAARLPSGAAPALGAQPLGAADLQQQTRDLVQGIFSVLAAERGVTGETSSHSLQVPLIACAAVVEPGTEAMAIFRIANEEAGTAEIALYTTNFVADTGYEIPSIAARVSPRKATVAPGGEQSFEVRIAVPSQTPAGMYSGLVQATNSRYVKAVIAFDVT